MWMPAWCTHIYLFYLFIQTNIGNLGGFGIKILCVTVSVVTWFALFEQLKAENKSTLTIQKSG